jgi:hypothetical protein
MADSYPLTKSGKASDFWWLSALSVEDEAVVVVPSGAGHSIATVIT